MSKTQNHNSDADGFRFIRNLNNLIDPTKKALDEKNVNDIMANFGHWLENLKILRNHIIKPSLGDWLKTNLIDEFQKLIDSKPSGENGLHEVNAVLNKVYCALIAPGVA